MIGWGLFILFCLVVLAIVVDQQHRIDEEYKDETGNWL